MTRFLVLVAGLALVGCCGGVSLPEWDCGVSLVETESYQPLENQCWLVQVPERVRRELSFAGDCPDGDTCMVFTHDTPGVVWGSLGSNEANLQVTIQEGKCSLSCDMSMQ